MVIEICFVIRLMFKMHSDIRKEIKNFRVAAAFFSSLSDKIYKKLF
jgi:hypothetical protein